MAGLAEDDLGPRSLWRRATPVAAALVAVLLLGALVWWLKTQLGDASQPQRQIARIAILPDLPPPPPPLPKEEAPPPPPQDKPPEPVDQPPPADLAPALKMEGAAGSGPSPFAAGTVTRELDALPAPAPPTAVDSGADRLQQRLYAQAARQTLVGELERHLHNGAVELTASFSIWLRRDGRIERFEVVPSGEDRHDAELRAALDLTARSLQLPQPPPSMEQPLRFRLTVRPVG